MLVKKYFFILMFFLTFMFGQNFLFAQARIMLGATATYINIYNSTTVTPTYLVVNNAASNAITVSAGWIISEGEYSYLKWVGTTATSYTVPFGYSTSAYLPFTFNKTVAGTSDLIMSTWTTASNNQVSGSFCGATNVAAVSNLNINGVDVSVADVVDRWWKINTTATADLTFSYRAAENNTTTTPAGNIGAQHWNGSSWDGIIGSAVGATAGVGTVAVTGVTTFSPWILSKIAAPLPVTWLDFSAKCNHGNVTLNWSTASEQNSNYFLVERSLDAEHFSVIGTVDAAGNSNTVKNYSVTDLDSYKEDAYYRVREIDFNGDLFISKIISAKGCSDEDLSFSVFPNPAPAAEMLNVSFTDRKDAEVLIVLNDLLGRDFYSKVVVLSSDQEIIAIDPTHQLPPGVYMVVATSDDKIYQQKIVIQ